MNDVGKADDPADVDRPERDTGWDDQARKETPTQRLDRNWGDLRQEPRVVQTGVQLLTGFLLTLPFQVRFSQLTRIEPNIYLGTVACSVLATGLLIAPVSLHRLLFRQHARGSWSALPTAWHWPACSSSVAPSSASWCSSSTSFEAPPLGASARPRPH